MAAEGPGEGGAGATSRSEIESEQKALDEERESQKKKARMQLEQQLYEEANLQSEPLRESTAVAVFNLVVNIVTISVEKYHSCALTDTLGQKNGLLLEYLFVTNSTLVHTVMSCMLQYFTDEELSDFAQDNGRFLLFLLSHRKDIPELNESCLLYTSDAADE